MKPKRMRRGARVGKYRIVRYIGAGGFAKVYQAKDEVEGRAVALKLPDHALVNDDWSELLKEVRIMVRFEHPNVLPILNADLINGQLVIAYPLAEETLSDRLARRLGGRRALTILEDIVSAVAYAHERRVIHCDINPQNVLLFADGSTKLADFGLARVATRHTIIGSGSGTIGYVAPEQAMGRPSYRSDVFSLGLIAYRLFAGVLPQWPYQWPPAQHARLKRRVSPAMVDWIRRATEVTERKRFRDAGVMASALFRLKDVLR